MLEGVLLVNKPAGITSFDVVHQIKKSLGARYRLPFKKLPKIGHGGTLDPFATGLLVVLIGRTSKLSQYFLGSEKTYRGRIHFGRKTNTGDPTGEVLSETKHLPTRIEEIQNAALSFVGEYAQIPPMFSAKKKDGNPLYLLARKGIEVERNAKICEIFSFNVSDLQQHANGCSIQFEVGCSAGTYIRTLAEDLGSKLKTLAYLESLERTHSGLFSIENARSLDEIKYLILNENDLNHLSCFVPFDQALPAMKAVTASVAEATALRQGRQSVLLSLIPRLQQQYGQTPDRFSIIESSKLVAVASLQEKGWRLERVF